MPKNGPNPNKRSMTATKFMKRAVALRYEAAGATTLEEYAKALGATIGPPLTPESVDELMEDQP